MYISTSSFPKQILILLFAGMMTPRFASSQIFLLRTQPSGATITDEKDKSIGETPFDISKIVKLTKKIKIKKDGYETVEISFPEKIKKLTEFPDCIHECNSCSMLFDNYPNIKKEKYSGTLILHKKFEEIENSIFVTIDTPKIDMSPETELGKINGSTKRINTRDIHTYIGYSENMSMQMLSAFDNSYLEPIFSNEDNKRKTNLYRPKIILAPVIKRLRFDFEGSLLRDMSGPCEIECCWNISTLADAKKILASITVKSCIYRPENDYEIVLHEMIAASEKDLLENDTLYSFLHKIQDGYFKGLQAEPMVLKKPVRKNSVSLKDVLKETSASVVTVETEKGFGSGVVISDEGYIITNHHVIEEGGDIFVKIGTDKKIKAELIRKNSDFDIALLKIESKGTGLHSISFGDSDESAGGEEVYAIGTPLDKKLGQSITKGIISGYREWNGVKFIQTDVSINNGNSGGPLINDKGEVIGITTLKFIGKNVEGIGFCIPSDLVVEGLNLKFE